MLAKGMVEGDFLNVDAVKQRQRGGNEHDEQANPVARMNADGQENDQHAEVRRVPNPAIHSAAIDGLRRLNGDIRAERFSQRKDRGPSNGESENEDDDGHMSSASAHRRTWWGRVNR